MHSVWTLSVDPARTATAQDKVELSAETIRKVTADIASQSERRAQFDEPSLNVEALRILYS